MGNYGEEFINVDEILTVARGLAGGDLVRTWQEFSRLLYDRLGGLRDRGGGYVYFPPGNYTITREIDVWPNITAIFAPGVVIAFTPVPAGAPLSTKSIVIQGNIQAGLHQIVEPSYGPDGLPNGRGTLLFQTDTIKEIYPEWFGAQSIDVIGNRAASDPRPVPDSRAGLQSAVDAAVHNFQTMVPIPIVLSGRYQISGPIYVGRRPWATASDVELRPFILRGRAGPSSYGRGTLASHSSFPAARAASAEAEENSLLIVRGPRGFLIENVHFDASHASTDPFVFSCLRIEKWTRGSGGNAQMSRVRRCSFTHAAGVLVQLGEFRNPYGEPGSTRPHVPADGEGGSDLLGLVFEGCDFKQPTLPPAWSTNRVRRDAWDAVAERHRWLRDGVYYRAANALRVHFLDCWWNGMMRAGIRAFSGAITITNCNFHIQRMPVPDATCVLQDARYSSLLDPMRHTDVDVNQDIDGRYRSDLEKITDARDNGCDIYVDTFVDVPRMPWTTEIGVRNVDSQSWRFLASFPATEVTRLRASSPNWDVYLQDVHLSSVGGRGEDEDLLLALIDWERTALLNIPPAVEWLGPFTLGASLTLSGVFLESADSHRGLENPAIRTPGQSYRTRFSGRVVMGQQSQTGSAGPARLTDLGTRGASGHRHGDAAEPDYVLKIASGSMSGPTAVTRANSPWYLNLTKTPRSLPGG